MHGPSRGIVRDAGFLAHQVIIGLGLIYVGGTMVLLGTMQGTVIYGFCRNRWDDRKRAKSLLRS